jgi:hypothetical protein
MFTIFKKTIQEPKQPALLTPRNDDYISKPDHNVNEVHMIASTGTHAIYASDNFFFYALKEGNQLYVIIFDKIKKSPKIYMKECIELVDGFYHTSDMYDLVIY